MTFDELHELAAVYALGALDPSEVTEFEHHLNSCDRCRREVADFSDVVGKLAQADAVRPPPQLRSRVLDQIARTPQATNADPAATGSGSDPSPGSGTESPAPVIDLSQERARRTERGVGRILLTAAAVIVIVIGGAAALLTIADRDDAYDAVAAEADAVTLELESDFATVTVVYSPDLDQVGVLSTDLPDPGEGRTYELWLVVDTGVAPAGLFVPDDGDVREVLSVDDVVTQGFGITIEPEGGSDQPTGDILFFDTFET